MRRVSDSPFTRHHETAVHGEGLLPHTVSVRAHGQSQTRCPNLDLRSS